MKDYDISFYHDMIDCIIAALEARDARTANHSRRVSDMTEQVCALLKLPKSQSEKIHLAAHVHDIGKIGIADSVLMKAEPLDDAEWRLIMAHPQIGAHILSKSKGLSQIAYLVLCHHERWDGNGYPNRIKQNAIPLGSHIIAVCDSIDAMMSQRAYRACLTSEECRDEILKNSGIMYDPDIVGVVIDHWDSMTLRYNSSE